MNGNVDSNGTVPESEASITEVSALDETDGDMKSPKVPPSPKRSRLPMLSGETSIGKYPFRAIQTMSDIAMEIEASTHITSTQITEMDRLQGRYNSVVRAACYAAQEGDRPMVVFTWSGNAAIVASRARPPKPIFAITPSTRVADKLRLVWGVHALVVPHIESTDELITATEEALKAAGFLESGDEVVILGGAAPIRGAANLMKIEIID